LPPRNKRTPDSLRQRWARRIRPEVKEFNACYVQVVKAQPSGCNKDDYIEKAKAEFTTKLKGLEFIFFKCWEVLQSVDSYNCNKQLAAALEASESGNDPSPTHSVVSSAGSNARPQGTKAAKAQERAEKMKAVEHNRGFQKEMKDMTGASKDLVVVMAHLADTQELARLDENEISLVNQYIAIRDVEVAREIMQERRLRMREERNSLSTLRDERRNLPSFVRQAGVSTVTLASENESVPAVANAAEPQATPPPNNAVITTAIVTNGSPASTEISASATGGGNHHDSDDEECLVEGMIDEGDDEGMIDEGEDETNQDMEDQADEIIETDVDDIGEQALRENRLLTLAAHTLPGDNEAQDANKTVQV